MASTAADASPASESFRRCLTEVNRYETARTSFWNHLLGLALGLARYFGLGPHAEEVPHELITYADRILGFVEADVGGSMSCAVAPLGVGGKPIPELR